MFLQRSEVGKAFQLVRESTRNNVSTVIWATGALDHPQIIEIPVDSVTKRITFTLSVDMEGSSLSITQPSGRIVSQGSADTEITELLCGKIVTMTSPEAGTWRLEITGKGRFWFEAQAQSDTYFVGLEFVREGGRPGHEGLFRIEGQPVAGVPAIVRARLSAAASSAEFYLASERGEMIEHLQMQPVNPGRDILEFLGSVEPPNVPFRVAVTGRDANGMQYQRFFPGLFHAETVEVSQNLSSNELYAGSTQRVLFTVQNTGPARRFRMTVTDAHHFVSRVEPLELPLGPGESGTVVVDLTVPPETAPGIGDDLIIVAASTAGPPTSNSSVIHFSVIAPNADQKSH
jgi:von Willebrand factor A domain-containing protein 7